MSICCELSSLLTVKTLTGMTTADGDGKKERNSKNEKNKQNNKHINNESLMLKSESNPLIIECLSPSTIQYTGLNFEIRPQG